MSVNPSALTGLEPPFYVVDLPRLERKMRAFHHAFEARFPRVVVAISYKTATLPAMFDVLHRQGAWAEVVSELELSLAERLAAPQIVFNGPGKPKLALKRALLAGIRVNLDSLHEVKLVAELAREVDQRLSVGLRVNLELPDHPVPGTRSRFGLPVADGSLAQAANELSAAGVAVAGLHAHLTSRRRLLDYYRALARELVAAFRVLGEQALSYVDVGGGYGYLPPEASDLGLTMPSFEEYADALFQELSPLLASAGEPLLIAEPGIALFGDAIEYHAPVLDVKRIAGRTLCVIDGSVHTVKPTRHAVNLPTRVFDRHYSPKTGNLDPYDVVGYTCLEDDCVAKDQLLPPLQPGDVLAIGNVGAYTFVFKPQFIRAMPAFYLYDGVSCRLARAAEGFESFFQDHVKP
jgi:diaminopimelate decarboxylase